MADTEITYVVERSARRTLGIYVERDGCVVVRAPQDLSNEHIAAAVKSRQRWVYRTRARWAQLNPKRAGKEFVSGETVYFLGRPHRLDFRQDAAKRISLEGDLFVIRAEVRPRAEELLRGFYRSEGMKRLPDIVDGHARSMGVAPGQVKVLELGHRWASCSAKGALNFNWKAMAAPVEVLHYLAVHELAHLKHRDHSPRFWHVVDAEMPGWKAHADWLRLHGAEMTL